MDRRCVRPTWIQGLNWIADDILRQRPIYTVTSVWGTNRLHWLLCDQLFSRKSWRLSSSRSLRGVARWKSGSGQSEESRRLIMRKRGFSWVPCMPH